MPIAEIATEIGSTTAQNGVGVATRSSSTPSRRWAKHNIVLYHGLAYGAGAWMNNPDVDLHCANSPYLARVLRALHAFPDWRGRRCLDPRVFGAVTDMVLPVPCVDFPQGHAAFSEGTEIPVQVGRLLQQGTVVGHALQGRKHDVMATLGIMHWLNEIARAHASGLPACIDVAIEGLPAPVLRPPA